MKPLNAFDKKVMVPMPFHVHKNQQFHVIDFILVKV